MANFNLHRWFLRIKDGVGVKLYCTGDVLMSVMMLSMLLAMLSKANMDGFWVE